MKAYMGVEVQLHSFLTSALDESDQVHYLRRKSHGYPLISRLVGLQGWCGHFGDQ
jgi:hypothetical protein